MENKTSKGVIISLVLLSVVVIGLVGFIVYDKSNSSKNEENIVNEKKSINSNSSDLEKENTEKLEKKMMRKY